MRELSKLKVWEKAQEFGLDIYAITKSFPKEEIYRIANQIRRAAVSIPNNIAEGCGRKSKKELSDFLNIAMGSASEVEYLLLLSYDLHYLKDKYQMLNENLIEIRKMLNVFMQKIKTDINEN
ncbi:MAG: four helix bundle protein [Armatimonadetes bacterium]|nr:four helix bundle protein [Armatimonadota bacterium]